MENTITTPAMPQFVFADQHLIEDPKFREFHNHLMRGMTHKLNNLLAVIQGFSSLILMNDDLDPLIEENLGHMKDAAVNASGLSERILPAAGCVRIDPQNLRLNDYFAMVGDSFKEPCTKEGVPFQMNLPEGLPLVYADQGRLKEILMELLKNAAEAAKLGGGQVALDFVKPGTVTPVEEKRLDIFVRNTGSEIPADKLAKIFLPFESTRDSSHFGIGLTIAATLAAQMGMRLGVHSANQTTTFWLSVPLA